MLQQGQPEDFVIATGILHSVRELCDIAFSAQGLHYEEFVKVDQKFFRPTEEIPLVGDSSKAQEKLKWKSEKSFNAMIEEMIEYDTAEIKNQQ